MKRFLIIVLSLVGGLAVLLIAGFLLFWVARSLSAPRVAAVTVLEVDFEQPMIEHVPEDPIATYLLKGTPTVLGRVLALRRAAQDDRVVGLVARIGAGGMGLADTQEMRDAVQTFRESGKFAIAYSETFGEMAPGNGGYYLATGFDEIWLQPSGDIGLTGLALEHPFVRGTLDKLGIVPRMDQRMEYKNAMNFYTDKKFTAAHREAMTAMLASWYSQIVRGISEGRGLDDAEVRARVDRGPFMGTEAVEARLVDGLAYRDEVYAKVKERTGGDPTFLSLSKYGDRTSSGGFGPAVALIYAVGPVHRGPSGYDALSGEVTMGSDSVAKAIRDAVDDSSVKAILLRVDSPGGSYIASDTILRETQRAQDAGKPVVVSMGNTAASGGYFVAMSADKIVAEPGTLTGSIGVFGGKMITRELWGKIGMSWDEVHTSPNAEIWSSLQDYSPAQYERFQASLDRIYADFTGKVAEGRGIPLERVQEIARGRVWTGEEAKEIGLVDELGGYAVAIRVVKEVAGLDPDQSVTLKPFPKERTTFELFREAFEGTDAGQTAMAEALRRIQPLGGTLQQVALGPARYGVLSMPPLDLEP